MMINELVAAAVDKCAVAEGVVHGHCDLPGCGIHADAVAADLGATITGP
jgi:hypothetical protein